ncbi:MAG: hypothetical protein NVSMB25_06290 [Thermoleophilaceae bacterium]
MRGSGALLALAATAALGSCGGSPGDLLALDIRGGPAGFRPESLVVAVDGRATCNRRATRQISSADLLDARSIVRDAAPIAGGAQGFSAASPGGRRYRLRTQDGTVSWNETSMRLPAVLPRAELFALRLGRSLC